MSWLKSIECGFALRAFACIYLALRVVFSLLRLLLISAVVSVVILIMALASLGVFP